MTDATIIVLQVRGGISVEIKWADGKGSEFIFTAMANGLFYGPFLDNFSSFVVCFYLYIERKEL